MTIFLVVKKTQHIPLEQSPLLLGPRSKVPWLKKLMVTKSTTVTFYHGPRSHDRPLHTQETTIDLVLKTLRSHLFHLSKLTILSFLISSPFHTQLIRSQVVRSYDRTLHTTSHRSLLGTFLTTVVLGVCNKTSTIMPFLLKHAQSISSILHDHVLLMHAPRDHKPKPLNYTYVGFLLPKNL